MGNNRRYLELYHVNNLSRDEMYELINYIDTINDHRFKVFSPNDIADIGFTSITLRLGHIHYLDDGGYSHIGFYFQFLVKIYGYKRSKGDSLEITYDKVLNDLEELLINTMTS